MQYVFEGATQSSEKVTAAMFGGNLLFKFNLISQGESTFVGAADLLGVTGLRYPGGTMTEKDFDVTNPNARPDSLPSTADFVGISDFLKFTQASGRDATIVLPTAKLYDGNPDPKSDTPRQINQDYLDDVANYVRLLLTQDDEGKGTLPDAPMKAFEIGNEYWGSGNMTATEYGQAVNALLARISDVFDDTLQPGQQRPEILIQMGSPWGAQFRTGLYQGQDWLTKVAQSNQNIIDQLTNSKAVAMIDGLVEHYYYEGLSPSLGNTPASLAYIDRDLKVWAEAGFGDLDLHLTEWNVKQENTAQFGLKGAGVLIEQMEYMVQLGADSAFAWPVQGWPNSLAGEPETTPRLTPAGAAFRLMSESLDGMHVVESNISGGALEVDAFASKSSAVFFAMSRSDVAQQVSIDISGLVSGYKSFAGMRIGVAEGVAIDDPTAAAIVRPVDFGPSADGGHIELTLNPYEIVRIWYQLTEGSKMVGKFKSDVMQGGNGSDTLIGNGGNDSLTGGKGTDWVTGGAGNDFLSGWGGNDHLMGSAGNDRMFGQEGVDRLFGGNGRDYLSGGDGNDVLVGGAGADTLFGDSGGDSFVFDTALTGAADKDKILDFDPSVDVIELDNSIFKGLWAGDLAKAAFRSDLAEGLTQLHRILYDSHTGEISYDRDGGGSRYQPVIFAQVAAGLHLSSDDFLIF